MGKAEMVAGREGGIERKKEGKKDEERRKEVEKRKGRNK